jgi:thioredoxin 2
MIRACSSCGAANRVPARHLADRGTCGKCKAALPPVDGPIDVDGAAGFDEIVKEARVPILVDFWAAWCGPCRAVAPHVKQVAHDMAGRALVVKVDTDKHGAVAARFGVRGIPNFVVIKNGSVVAQNAGAVDVSALRGWLESAGA